MEIPRNADALILLTFKDSTGIALLFFCLQPDRPYAPRQGEDQAKQRRNAGTEAYGHIALPHSAVARGRLDMTFVDKPVALAKRFLRFVSCFCVRYFVLIVLCAGSVCQCLVLGHVAVG